ncbi:MAG: benzoate-CoA ligase family protein [Firmicutes bacterium]|nr:benzoate-CoA ligase family protein [Bacillota bacterium]
MNAVTALFSTVLDNAWLSRPAVYYRNRVLTYNDMLTSIHQVSHGLTALGIKPESRLLLIGYDTPEFLSLFYGAIESGIVPVPVNTYLPSDDYLYFLKDSGARVLCIEAELWPHLAPVLAESEVPLDWVMILHGKEFLPARPEWLASSAPLLFFEPWRAAQPPLPTVKEAAADEPAFWLYSSGSTGRPKAAVHVHHSIVQASVHYGREVLQITPDDRLFSGSKLFFAYGLGNSSYLAFAQGASVVLERQKAEAATLLADLYRYRPTLFFAVPTLFQAMLSMSSEIGQPLSFLRACVSAGEPLPSEVARRWRQRFGVDILDGLGSTEALHVYISQRLGDASPGGGAWVVPGYEVKVVDEAGQPLPDGEIGDLWLKGDTLFFYYWNQRERTRTQFVGPWYRTGDKVLRQPDGRLFYQGRSDDMIKVNGLWVSPVEVEHVLMTHPAVDDAAVVGIPDNAGLMQLHAFVVLTATTRQSPRMDEVLTLFVRQSLAPYKAPRVWHWVDALPKTATGKIQRQRLREGMGLMSIN